MVALPENRQHMWGASSETGPAGAGFFIPEMIKRAIWWEGGGGSINTGVHKIEVDKDVKYQIGG